MKRPAQHPAGPGWREGRAACERPHGHSQEHGHCRPVSEGEQLTPFLSLRNPFPSHSVQVPSPQDPFPVPLFPRHSLLSPWTLELATPTRHRPPTPLHQPTGPHMCFCTSASVGRREGWRAGQRCSARWPCFTAIGVSVLQPRGAPSSTASCPHVPRAQRGSGHTGGRLRKFSERLMLNALLQTSVHPTLLSEPVVPCYLTSTVPQSLCWGAAPCRPCDLPHVAGIP